MSEPFNLFKMLSSPLTGIYWVKCLMIGLGICMLGFIGYGMYKAYIKQIPSTEQRAETINNYYHQPKSTFGCATIKIYEKYRQPETNMVR